MQLNDIVELNRGLIYKIASKFYNVDKEDLFQAGALGVIKAYKNYQENGNTKFSTYAYDFIFGEMYNFVYMQKQIKVSKDYLKLYKEIEKTRYSLAQKLNRIPSNSEIALFLEKDIDLINQVIEVSSYVMSLDKDSDNDRSIYEAIPSSENLSIDERIAINESINTLNEEEKQIIKYRYFEDLTQSEIASKLNMTQVMVSRYLKKSINKLREYYVIND
jgi:RNA polymerase sporulation-specific sigma factor